MICKECEGEGYIKETTKDDGLLIMPCLECMGSGIVSCCDNAGITFDPKSMYHNNKYPERNCDKCGAPYRGPAVYCSLKCALDDV